MNTTTVAPRPSILYRPQGIILTIGAIVILWSLMRGNLTALVLLAIAALFIIGLKKPLWVMAALLVSQLTLTSYMVPTPFVDISLRLLLLILTLFVLGRAFIRREVDLGPGARRLFIPILLLISVSVIANLVNSGFDYAFKDFRNMLVGLLFVVFLAAIIENLRQLKTLCSLTFIVITASAVIGLMQHYNFLGIAEATLIPGFLTTAKDLRIPGMGETELELSYVLPAALMVVFCIYLTKGVSSGNRRLLLVSMFPMIPALYFTYTRSAVFALGLGLLSIVLYIRTRIKWEIILVLLFLVVSFFEATDLPREMFLGARSKGVQEESSISRPILWQAGVAIALDNPVLGIGGNQFHSISPQYANRVDPSFLEWEEDRYWNYRTLGTQLPHNDFLGVWVSYGTIALALYLWLFFAILRNCWDSFHTSKRRFIKGLSLGIAGALVTYLANSFYHNLLTTMPLFFILAGFSLTTAKLATKRKASVKVSPVDTGNMNI